MSRLIEDLMCEAVTLRKAWKRDNTTVEPVGESHCHVYLHGHRIATYNYAKAVLMVNEAILTRCPSCTTKSRVRALRSRFTWEPDTDHPANKQGALA